MPVAVTSDGGNEPLIPECAYEASPYRLYEGSSRATIGVAMGKRGRKKRSRKGNAANHGKRPNS